jgi:hypothetical protein
LALDAMIRLGELELGAGNAEAAMRAADRAIAANDVRRMRTGSDPALAMAGRRPDALRHYSAWLRF